MKHTVFCRGPKGCNRSATCDKVVPIHINDEGGPRWRCDGAHLLRSITMEMEGLQSTLFFLIDLNKTSMLTCRQYFEEHERVSQ